MLIIKRAQVQDAFKLSELGRTTFVETFGKDNTPEDLAQYVENTYTQQKQINEISAPNNIIEIAWVGDKAVGFLYLKEGKVNPSVSGKNPVELLRLYVDSSFHGKKVGAALMNRAIDLAKEKGFKTLWLGVWENNLKAQKFYKNFGFQRVGAHIFQLGSDEQTDYIFALDLK